MRPISVIFRTIKCKPTRTFTENKHCAIFQVCADTADVLIVGVGSAATITRLKSIFNNRTIDQ